MATVNRIGFTQVGNVGARNGPYRTNIIFVHGLRGHPRHTWETQASSSPTTKATPSKKSGVSRLLARFKPTARKADKTDEDPSPKVFWPEDYLAEDIPEARVWTYGYDADVIGSWFQSNNKNSVSQHGRDLRNKIEREIDNEDPIVFVAHSLGGVIVKDAFHRSEICRKRTRLIVFLGTPHRGSSITGWGVIASNFATLALMDSNKKIVETLEVNGEVLDNIHEQFKNLVVKSETKVFSFYEGCGMAGMKGLDNKVVDDFSSKLDLPDSVERVESINANHREMARCNSRDDARYRAVKGVLKKYVNNIVLEDRERLQLGRPRTPPIVVVGETRSEASCNGATATVSGVLPCHHIPFKKNSRFVGREGTLNELKALLFDKKCPSVALIGLGGVGKTQVALELAYWTKENKADFSIFWVPALNVATFKEACAEIANKLKVDHSNDEDVRKSVQQYLGSKAAGPWLLIVDNADDDDGFDSFLPQSENGRVVLTTRSKDVASKAADRTVKLEELSLLEAKAVLEKWVTQKDLISNDALVTELICSLVYLPLAITQAAAYMERNAVSTEEYLRLLRNTEKDTTELLSKDLPDKTRYKELKNAVAATWIVSFRKIRELDSNAASLLSFMSQIEPKAIPRSILPKLGSEVQTQTAIGTLLGYAFVSKQGDMLDMHSLVHLSTQIWLNSEGFAAQTIENAVRHLEKVFPVDDHENRHVWRMYLPHALRVLQQVDVVDMKERSELCFWVGRCLQIDGRIKEALRCFQEYSQWTSDNLAEDHPDRLVSQHELARAYKNNGQIKKAVALLEQVGTIEERTLAEDDPIRLESQHILAMAYRYGGQIKKSVALLERVVVIEETILKEEDPIRLESQHVLAVAYQDDGQIKKAVALLEQVVAITGTLTEDHPDRLASQHELARAYNNDGQIEKAVTLLEQVVAIKERALKEDHPDRLASQHELARAYNNDGQIEKAVTLLEQVVAIKERALKEDHPDRLASQHELARAYKNNGQIKKAVALLEQVVAIKGTLAEDHPDRLASQHELAMAYKNNGQIKKAVALLEQVVAIKGTLAEDHPDRLASQHELAMAYQEDRKYLQAIELLRHVVEVDARTLPEDHPSRLLSLSALKGVLEEVGEQAVRFECT